MKWNRNEIMKTIHRKMKKLDEQKLENRLKEIENSKNDSLRMFQVIKETQRQNPKMPLLIKTETGGFTINGKKQDEIIATHFIEAIRSLWNNKSVGDDQIKAEMLKSVPDILPQTISWYLQQYIRNREVFPRIDTPCNNANTETLKTEMIRSEPYHALIDDKKSLPYAWRNELLIN